MSNKILTVADGITFMYMFLVASMELTEMDWRVTLNMLVGLALVGGIDYILHYFLDK